jgi:hypothetical protein
MKRLQGQASKTVDASIDRCFAVLRAVDGYPSWDPELFQAVDVLEQDAEGNPVRAHAKLRVVRSGFTREFDLIVAVHAKYPGAVHVQRIPHDAADQEKLDLAWTLEADGATRITLAFSAAIASIPSLLPLRGAGDGIAGHLVGSVARALT